MSTTGVETASEIRPFHVEFPEEELAELRRRIARDALARTRRLVDDEFAGRAAGDAAGARPLLG